VSSVDTPSITNTQFANVKLKDAIVDRIRQKMKRRPDSGSANDKAVVFLFWHGSAVSIYLDTSGIPISKRGYRKYPHKAPLSEVLAASIIASTKWTTMKHFVNPMCGSGTLAIEASLIATRTPSQWNRDNFGFKHSKLFNSIEWEEIVHKASAERKEDVQIEIIASDRDSNAIMASRRNAQHAGMLKYIDFSMCDFRKTRIPDGEGVVVLNPEYGDRLGRQEMLEGVYKNIGDWFKKECKEKTGYVFTGNQDLAKNIGLRASRRIPLFNADVECRLLEYEMYEGTRRTD
jgi:putative N6-adenine-specific DNA methylase